MSVRDKAARKLFDFAFWLLPQKSKGYALITDDGGLCKRNRSKQLIYPDHVRALADFWNEDRS